MPHRAVTSRRAVLSAIAEHDALGQTTFLTRYGFHPALTYVLRHEGHAYDSKAILGVAHRYQFPDIGPLRSDQFSGGRQHAAGHLHRLGFTIDGIQRTETDWSLEEVVLITDTYFAMRDAQVRRAYDRRGYLDRAVAALPARNESAISRKLSNISAILEDRGLPLLRGFGALGNTQTLLEAVVVDWLSENADAFAEHVPPGAPEDRDPEVEPPAVADMAAANRQRRGVRVDFAAQDERNRRLGRAGEEWAFDYLKRELRALGRADLADRVVWVARDLGDGLGYDIASFEADGSEICVEVKTTNGAMIAPFIVTANEVTVSSMTSYVLMRIFDFSESPRFYRVRGPLDRNCWLAPRVFAALPRILRDL